MRERTALTLVAMLSAVPALCDESAAARVGTPVRVTAPSMRPEPFVGVVAVAGVTTLVLELEPEPGRPATGRTLITIPRASIVRFEDLAVPIGPNGGARVRLRAVGGRSLVGTLAGVDRDSLTVLLDAGPDEAHRISTIPRAEIVGLDVPRASRGHSRAKGALIGGAIGLAVNVAAVAALVSNIRDARHDTTGPIVVPAPAGARASADGAGEVGAWILLTSPTLLGIAIGAAVGGGGDPGWTPVAIPESKISLRLEPARGRGVRAGLTFAF